MGDTAFDPASVKALLFDVFGTVVDWRSSIIREGRAFGAEIAALGLGADIDWESFADEWRGLYQPSMDRVVRGERDWINLDGLHREGLDLLLARHGIKNVPEAVVAHFNRAWHRLNPWLDTVDGLTRLKRRYIIAPHSNGNIAMMVAMARRAGLPWDAILGAETARRYKADRQSYLTSAALLDLAPGQCLMVAAHNGDLQRAASVGLRTAFVLRPNELGPGRSKDPAPTAAYDVVASDFKDLADKLGC
ncbi:MAG: haloacid dehalogenase type II [Proteobacteria bacterium]|jgi:2-haloacid dehalogenase|nr:haloacid dehalogenase type II [Pseudomonadota bacterium]